MPNFNYLQNNQSSFPNIDNVDVYKFDNEFDYSRYDSLQMRLTICTVPWDMGEAHVGNRTISGIGNVVYFGSKAKRDEWFAAIPDTECFRFETKYKELHRDKYIDVPIPFDVASKYNYLAVEYSLFANDDSPIAYEGDEGVRKWFWFIREVEFLAPSTTRLHILDDAFQTWIYDVNVSYMVLERGHAPMFATRADAFLSNPLANNTYLLTEDVSFGDASQVMHIDAVQLNAGTMYACVATSANPTGNWTNNVPGIKYRNNDGAPSVYVFAMSVADLNTFLSNVTDDIPQFKQTIQGVFFASEDLITIGASFTFADVTCYQVSSSRKSFDLTNLDKSLFGYQTAYADIAKLYTWPYAHIEVTDADGNVTIVRIEDSTGDIDVYGMFSLAFPNLTIDAHLRGVGGNATKTVTLANVTSRTFAISGQWYETLYKWKVPTFAVYLDATREYSYSSKYDRAQMAVDYNTALTIAEKNADTMKTCEDRSANTIVSNASLTTAANTAITTRSNTSADTSFNATYYYNNAMNTATEYSIQNNATSTIAANEQQGAIGAASSVAGGVASAIGSAATGNVAGAVSGAISGLIGGASTLATMSVANALTAAQSSNAQLLNVSSAYAATHKSDLDTENQKDTASDITKSQNTMTSGIAANSASTQKQNATTEQTAAYLNAQKEATRAQSAITNLVNQASLRAPFEYGTFADGDTAVTRPIALFSHIVTQSKAAIQAAGEHMLRYGYALDMPWAFDGDWNVGKYFTYWKLSDFWISDLNVPDMYMDKLRFFLYGGVTVWRSPEYIGKVSVYDNYNG